VVGIALWSFLWTYASLCLGLDRLGGKRLRSAAALGDSALGLRPLGGVAFTGLWMLLAWLVPLLTGLPDVVGFGIGVAVLSGALAVFLLSLLRLHWRMVEVKEGELGGCPGALRGGVRTGPHRSDARSARTPAQSPECG
jgi:hypothetical protein